MRKLCQRQSTLSHHEHLESRNHKKTGHGESAKSVKDETWKMCTKTDCSVTNLVPNSCKRVDDQDNCGDEGVDKVSDWEGCEDGQAAFQEVANASVSAVIVSDLSIGVENNSARGSIIADGLFVNELVGSDISSWWHDCLFVYKWENVDPSDRVGENDNRKARQS